MRKCVAALRVQELFYFLLSSSLSTYFRRLSHSCCRLSGLTVTHWTLSYSRGLVSTLLWPLYRLTTCYERCVTRCLHSRNALQHSYPGYTRSMRTRATREPG